MNTRRDMRGFTLIEVLVSLIIIGVGMLGIAKLQAMSYASTGTASFRSVAAIQAASLAAAMRANRNYWTAPAATTGAMPATGVTMSVTSGSSTPTVSINDATVAITLPPPALSCPYAGTGLAPNVIAGCDLSTWAASINSLLPAVNATVTCAPATPVSGVTQPIGCTIQLNWSENQTGINAQSVAQSGGPAQSVAASNATGTSVNGAQTNYTLYVEP
jgi:type IV pilus assembly protein PilV